MMKTLGMAIVGLGVFSAVVGCDSRESTAQTQPAGNRGAAKAKELTLDLGNNVTMKLVQIPAGKFTMGSPQTEKHRESNETQHEVTISKPFYMGVTHVTVDQYRQFCTESGVKFRDPGFEQAGDHPAASVSWNDAQAFCQWLSKKTGKTVVLPTEAQWEYACRAGTKTRFSFGDRDKDLGDYAWHHDNSLDRITHPVGRKRPNAWGLYDMHGNADQWCSNYYDGYADPAVDPAGAEEDRGPVLRGGAWLNKPWQCRSASRFVPDPDSWWGSGFRVVVAADVD